MTINICIAEVLEMFRHKTKVTMMDIEVFEDSEVSSSLPLVSISMLMLTLSVNEIQ